MHDLIVECKKLGQGYTLDTDCTSQFAETCLNWQEELEEGEISKKTRARIHESSEKKIEPTVRCTSPPVKEERTKDTKSKMKFDAAVQEAEMYMNREEEQQVVDIPSDSTQKGGKKIMQSVKV